MDSNRLAIWGISYSGGHALVIGATDPRIRCVVSNIPVIVSRLLLTDMLDGTGRDSPLKLASLYPDQKPPNDISRLLAASHRFPIKSSISETLGRWMAAPGPTTQVTCLLKNIGTSGASMPLSAMWSA